MGLLRPRGLHWNSVARLCFAGKAREWNRPLHVFLCIADHYEPLRGKAPLATQRERVERWRRDYPVSVAGLKDSRGRAPQHTFFYPAEEYVAEHLDNLAELCHRGYGEVEIHLHHDGDCAHDLRETLCAFKETLFHRHGLLAKTADGEISYGFIHGNWALDNSRPDGRWCGVNDELTVLRETGCYADFTMPSAPNPCQTRMINSIYYAFDDPARPKSHDRGLHARVGMRSPGNGLLMIQGPLAFGWKRRGRAIYPALENGELHGGRPPTRERLRFWLQAGVSVAGRPDWIFVKLHTHGAWERNADMLLGEPMRRFHESLAELAERQPELQYYYVTAREMASLVAQAEQGAHAPDWSAMRWPLGRKIEIDSISRNLVG